MRTIAQWRLLPACAFFLFAVTGCGKTGTVKGMVKFDGKPIPEGEITFVGPGDKKVTGGIKDGEYEAKNVPAGECKVAIDTSKSAMRGMSNPQTLPPGISPTSPQGKKMLEEMKKKGPSEAGKDKAEYMPIPENFKDPEKSKLTITVEKGTNEQNFDLEKPKGWTPPKTVIPGRPGG